jgi:hypothetical protein
LFSSTALPNRNLGCFIAAQSGRSAEELVSESAPGKPLRVVTSYGANTANSNHNLKQFIAGQEERAKELISELNTSALQYREMLVFSQIS